MRLRIKVIPGAARSGLAGWMGNVLKIRVTAPPEKGKANDAVLELLAGSLGLPRNRFRIVSGASSPLKVVEVEVPDPGAVFRLLPPRD